ncbi:IPT/TIG domain-containing protein [Blastococcus sp. VKM Ac-2987]|uniref:IPT/TIG domain-containing protein n=1 Tax=Blastococcus sp. VKM Ac-2987 TaxID=3004141 RepID=UPI0022AB7D36|nr:IPT/TIG domain-containing protein [Blastococcus sp. VKM Ac-2987]MCZ2859875.1 IPT/TIG domain-containing protein [Blastococcus sp. VKM Ac-2987]
MRRHAHSRIAALAAGLLLTVPACGGAGDVGSDDQAEEQETATVTEPTESSPSGDGDENGGGDGNGGDGNGNGGDGNGGNGGDGNGNGGNDDDDGFSWVPWGPADPGDPPPFQWYGSLERRDCAGLQSSVADVEGRELWRALTAVCLAAVDGDASQWEVAEEQAAAVDDADDGGCLDEAARALLERALAWHREHPGQQPEVVFPAPGSATACPFEITQVQPAQGPVTGGTTVVLVGRGIDEPTEILFGTTVAEVTSEGSGESSPVEEAIEVRLPPADEPGPVDVRLRNRAGEVTAPAPFTYLTDEGGGSPPSESSAPESSGSGTADDPTPSSSDPSDTSDPSPPGSPASSAAPTSPN